MNQWDIEDIRGEDMYISYPSPDYYEECIDYLERQIAQDAEDYDAVLSEYDDIIEEMGLLLAKVAQYVPDEVKAVIAACMKKNAAYLNQKVNDA